MKLVIVTPIFPPETGGPATYVWQLSQKLKSAHPITIITFTPKPTKLQKVKLISINTKNSPIFRQLSLFLTVLVQSFNANTAYIQGPLVVGFAAVLACKLSNTRSLLKFVGDEAWESARLKNPHLLQLDNYYQDQVSLIGKFKKTLQFLSLSLADQIIVPSQYLKTFLIQTYRINPGKIKVIQNAVEISHKSVKKTPHQLIFVGRLVPWKNVDQIIQAVKHARDKKPWRLLIVGEGPQLTRLKKLTHSLQANSWVRFTGRLSKTNTASYIAKSQQLILYSSYEGLSHTLIEAMLLKTPIIASNIKANQEVTGKNALFVSLNHPRQLAAAINKSTNRTLQANNYAKQQYNWTRHINSLTKLL